MTDKHKGLIATIETKRAEAQTLLEKGPAITADDLDAVDRLTGEIDGLKAQVQSEIDLEAKASGLQGRLSETRDWLRAPAGNVVHPNGQFKHIGSQAAGAVQLNGDGTAEDDGTFVIPDAAFKATMEPAYKRAFKSYLRGGLHALKRDEIKNLEEGLDPQGGYLVPLDMLNRIISREPTPTRLGGAVTNVTTSRDRIAMARVNYASATDDSSGILYTTPFRVTWTGENPSSATAARVTDTNLFGAQSIPVFTAMISGIMTLDMVEDVSFDALGWVSGKFRETVDLIYDYMILLGAGVSQPTGMLSGAATAPATLTSAANPIVGDDLIDVTLNVPEQYENNLRWVFNKVGTFRTFRKLKDSSQRYLWGLGYQDSGLAAGAPKLLADYPYIFSGFVPSASAGATCAVFGDLTGYYKVNRVGFSIQVLRELYAERNQVGLVGRLRFGGDTVEPWRLRLFKNHS